AKTVHYNNQKRVLRALELYYQTGTTMSQQLINSKPPQSPYDAVVIGLAAKNRAFLYERINSRVEQMIKNGVLQEAEYVYQNKDSFVTAAQAIGYKEFFPYLEGKESLAVCTEQLKQASRKYAKRQLTWFNRVPNLHWVYIDDDELSPLQQVESIWEKESK
ncbi:MAG: tRNA dimethylallyltransferase, partial [Oscillospiraceae bacterium]|nr:tRNA dimethylallyltransferase [Oscillospiraceae bacterium]